MSLVIDAGHKGPHVTEVLSVDSSTATAALLPRPNFRSATSNGRSSNVSVEETGTVKWFNTENGFGCIARDSGAQDVFVHISAVERSGLTGLSEGDRVIVDVAEGRKGLEAQGSAWSRSHHHQFRGPVVSVSCSIAFASRLPEKRMRLAFCGLLLITAVLLVLRG